MSTIAFEATRLKRRYLERVIGQAFHEGAHATAIDAYLSEQGVKDPAALRERVEARKHLSSLGEQELKQLDGRAGFRALFGLPPVDGEVHQAGSTHQPTDFVAYLPDHTYFWLPAGEMWHAQSVRVHVESPASMDICAWLDRHRQVEQMTWWPGRPQLMTDTLIVEAGEEVRPGVTTLNLYRPPVGTEGGDPTQATLWLAHLRRLYPHDAEHLITWLAWRVQRPDVKINHGIVLGGPTRIGKDTILAPVRQAVGPWNVVDISPSALMGRFNGHVKSVILRVNETGDLGDVNRYQLYERSKWLLAAPPEVFRVDEKNLREHPVPNVTGVIFTTNYKQGGMYLPADDARHYVAWSEVHKEDFEAGYWPTLYGWYEHGGIAHVVAYLRQPERLTGFDPKVPPPRTEAWHEMVAANRAPEESELADILEGLQAPDAVTIQDLAERILDRDSAPALLAFGDWLRDRKNARSVPHRLEACGYVAVRNPASEQGLWSIDGKRQAVYVKVRMAPLARMAAARARAAVVRPKGQTAHVASNRQESQDIPF